MSKYQRLIAVFIAIYFGEPVLTQLVGKESSVLYQLGLFILALAVFKIITKKIFIAATVAATLVLMWLVYSGFNSALQQQLTQVVFALACAALISVIIEAWEIR